MVGGAFADDVLSDVWDSANHRLNVTTGTTPPADHTLATDPQSVRLSDGTDFLRPTTPADTQPISGSVAVSNLPATQPVSGAFWPATQPVSGPLTDSQLRATAVPVSGAFFQATQPISATALPLPAGAAQEHVTAVNPQAVRLSDGATFFKPTTPADVQPVSGTFWQATQPVSGSVSANQGGTWTMQPGNTPNTTPWQVQDKTPNDQGLTATGAAAAGVTLTLPAPGAGLFQYVGLLEITMYATAARTGGVTPTLVTSTNLPGSPVWTFDSAQAVGTTVSRLWAPPRPIRASVANTAVTIVCPATTSVIWRVNAVWTNAS